jgi:hypothetical protein
MKKLIAALVLCLSLSGCGHWPFCVNLNAFHNDCQAP